LFFGLRLLDRGAIRGDLGGPLLRTQYRMAHDLLSKLKPHGAKDMIDVQSFMYAIASDGYKEALQEAPAG